MDQEINALLEPNKSIVTSLRKIARIGSILVIAMGMISLILWQFRIPLSQVLFPHVIGMHPLAAIAYICGGFSLYLLLRKSHMDRPSWLIGVTIIFSSIHILIGMLTLMHTIVGIHSILGNALLYDQASGSSLSSDIGISFLFVGVSLMLLAFPLKSVWIRGAQLLTLLAAAISMYIITGYMYHTFSYYSADFSPMPLSSALTSTILCLAILFAISGHGLTKALTRNTPSSVLAFRLILITMTLPAVLGYISLSLERIGLYDIQTAIVLLVIGTIIIITAIVWFNTSSVQKLELENLLIRKAIEEKNVGLESHAKELAEKMLALEEENHEVYEKLINREKLYEVADRAD